MYDIDGKIAVVTGGSKGIGLEVVRQLLASGAKVYYLSRSRAAEHEGLSQQGSVTWIETDMADEASILAAFETIAGESGRIDILVNNAGITKDGLLMRMKTADWQRVLDVNLTGTFIACRAVTRLMAKQRSGSVVNISSVVGITGNAGQTNYAASKAGLIGFSKSMAKELAARGVRVNVIAPGFITTEMTDVLPEGIKDKLKDAIPMGRFGSVEDIASAVLFLSGSGSTYMTGTVLTVDGGMTM